MRDYVTGSLVGGSRFKCQLPRLLDDSGSGRMCRDGTVALVDRRARSCQPGWIRPSDHHGELVEGRSQVQPGQGFDSKLIVSPAQILDECVTSYNDAGGPVSFESAHRRKSCFHASVVGLDSIVGVLSGVVEGGRQELGDHSDQGMSPVGSDLGRLTV